MNLARPIWSQHPHGSCIRQHGALLGAPRLHSTAEAGREYLVQIFNTHPLGTKAHTCNKIRCVDQTFSKLPASVLDADILLCCSSYCMVIAAGLSFCFFSFQLLFVRAMFRLDSFVLSQQQQVFSTSYEAEQCRLLELPFTITLLIQ